MRLYNNTDTWLSTHALQTSILCQRNHRPKMNTIFCSKQDLQKMFTITRRNKKIVWLRYSFIFFFFFVKKDNFLQGILDFDFWLSCAKWILRCCTLCVEWVNGFVKFWFNDRYMIYHCIKKMILSGQPIT
jgi:hypothetical protein